MGPFTQILEKARQQSFKNIRGQELIFLWYVPFAIF